MYLDEGVIHRRLSFCLLSSWGRLMKPFSQCCLVLSAVLLMLQDAPGQEPIGNPLVDPASTRLNGTTIQGTQLLVAVSESGRTVHGWSIITGEAAKVTLDPAVQGAVIPVVGGEVAAFVHGTKAYAFGARSGKWAVVDLGVKEQPTVGLQHVEIRLGGKLFLFSTNSKNWTVIDLTEE